MRFDTVFWMRFDTVFHQKIVIWHCILRVVVWHCILMKSYDLTLYSHENIRFWHCISQDINAIWHCISWAKCDLTLYFMRIQCQITTIVFAIWHCILKAKYVIWHCILRTEYSVKSQYMTAIQWQVATNQSKYSAKSHFGRSNTVSNHRALLINDSVRPLSLY